MQNKLEQISDENDEGQQTTYKRPITSHFELGTEIESGDYRTDDKMLLLHQNTDGSLLGNINNKIVHIIEHPVRVYLKIHIHIHKLIYIMFYRL